MQNIKITDDLDILLSIIPPHITQAIREIDDSSNLLEVIIDLGRVPTARFLQGEVTLGEDNISKDEIDYVCSRVSKFDDDNRAGLERTLHRIAAIRNRRGDI
ncbi:MAG: AAA family ATPase, partial [Chloroflexota bacterium]|nr:AAA family ATPase [Chloroflexota bacterium]